MVSLIEEEIKRFATDGPTPDELAHAKSYLIGSYPLRFSTSTRAAAQLLAIQMDTLGIDYVDRRNGLVEAVTIDDVRRVAKRLFGGSDFIVVSVGHDAELRPGGRGEPRIGLALGGGAAHGFAHIPILEAFDELGIRPAMIAGTSMGAVIGAAYASGMSGAEIRDYALRVFHSRSEFLARLWQLRPRRISEINFGFGQYDLERVLAAFMPGTLARSFDELRLPASGGCHRLLCRRAGRARRRSALPGDRRLRGGADAVQAGPHRRRAS